MTQDGFLLTDEARTITVLNDSGTTAIEAGDLVFSAANDDMLSDTAASVRSSYAASDIKVKSIICLDAGYQTIVGVATDDIAADGYGSIALEGVYMHPVGEDVEAGGPVQGLEGNGTTVVIANKLQVADSFDHKCGQALTGGSADGKYIIWKLTL